MIICEVLEVFALQCAKPEICSVGFCDSQSQAIAWFRERKIPFSATTMHMMSDGSTVFTYAYHDDGRRKVA